ncbi:MAG: ABC transporter substrate-binding protein [Solirubrobacteraceae bacterium]
MQRLFKISPLATVGIAVISLGISACGGSSSGGGSGGGGTVNLKLGDVVELTGAAAEFGPSWDKAARLAAADANAAAKKAGVKLNVSVSTADEGSSPQTAVSATRKLVSEGAGCILGGLSSSDSIAMAEGVTIPGEVVQISPSSTSVLYGELHKKGGFTFRTIPSDALNSQLLADYMAKKLGGAQGKLVSVTAEDTSYGAPASKAFAEAWTKLGGSVQGPFLYSATTTSFDADAAKIVANHPTAFVHFDEPGTFAKLGAALLRTGQFEASKLYSSSGYPSEIPKGMPAAAIEGSVYVNAGLPPEGEALEEYEKAYSSSSIKPSGAQPYNENNYDAAMLCILAAAAAHSGEGKAIATHIATIAKEGATKYSYGQFAEAFEAIKAGRPIDYSGLSGSTQLDSEGDPTSTLATINQYRHGKLAQVSEVELVGGKMTEVKEK